MKVETGGGKSVNLRESSKIRKKQTNYQIDLELN